MNFAGGTAAARASALALPWEAGVSDPGMLKSIEWGDVIFPFLIILFHFLCLCEMLWLDDPQVMFPFLVPWLDDPLVILSIAEHHFIACLAIQLCSWNSD